jgi:TPR repeat protein
MRRYVLALVFLLLCPTAQGQSGFWYRFGEAVAAGIVANYANDHLKTYLGRWGSAGTPEGDYSEGLKQWRQGNRDEALRDMIWSAESGYSKAQLFLGDVCAEEGNIGNAKTWYEKSAAHQESWAEFQLGNLYYSGKVTGVPDYGTALGWYRKSASRHEVEAELRVAEILMLGKMHPTTPEETVEVAKLLQDAADLGSALARANLGYMYFQGVV